MERQQSKRAGRKRWRRTETARGLMLVQGIWMRIEGTLLIFKIIKKRRSHTLASTPWAVVHASGSALARAQTGVAGSSAIAEDGGTKCCQMQSEVCTSCQDQLVELHMYLQIIYISNNHNNK